MFKDLFDKLRRTAGDDFRIKENDFDIMVTLYRKERQKQYELEKNLKRDGTRIAHSTVTGRLQNLSTHGFVEATKGEDGLTYYELTPFGLSALLYRGRIDFDQALTHMENNQLKYLETLMRLQPKFFERLRRQPPWFVIQLTDSLWAVHFVVNRSELARQCMNHAFAVSRGVEPGPMDLKMGMQFLCVHRIEVGGEGICMEERAKCIYKPREIVNCEIVGKQMSRMLEKLEQRI